MSDHRSFTRPWGLTAAALLALTVGACGSDGDGGSGAATPPITTGTPTATTVSTTEISTTAAPTTEVATTEVATTSVGPSTSVGEGQPAANIEIVITDRSIEVSGPVRPGGAIRFDNHGDEAHYIQIRKIVDGKTYDDALRQLDSLEGMDAVAVEIGAPGNVLAPGNSVTIAYPHLEAGEYILADWFPVEGDDSGTYHANVGLVARLTVEGEAALPPLATANYRVSTGAPIDGPTSLSPGHQELHIVFEGSASGFPTLFRVDDADVATIVQHLNSALARQPWPKGTGREIATYLLTSTFGPFSGGNDYTIGIDFEVGRYALVNLAYDDNGAAVAGVETIEFTVG